MSGLRMKRGRKSAILEIPTRDKGKLLYFTSLTYLKKFVNGEIPVVYFNPRSDFAVEEKEIAVD